MVEKTRLLLIDDNEEILVSLKNYFRKQQFEVETATNGLEGLKIIEAAKEPFAIIVTDLVMPHVSGVAIITLAKKKWPKVPVIAITGYGEHPEALAKEVMADIVIEKPFKVKELEDYIQRLVNI